MSRMTVFIAVLCAIFAVSAIWLVYSARQGAYLEGLRKDLADTAPVVREKARTALVAMKSRRAIRVFIDLLDTDADQDNVIRGLVDIGEPAVDPLINALPDEDDSRSAAFMAQLKAYIVRLSPGFAARLPEGFVAGEGTNKKPGAVEALAAIGRPAIPQLVKAVKKGSVNRKAAVAWILGLIGDPEGIDALVVAAKDDNALVRASAVHALGEAHGDKPLDVIIDALKDKDLLVSLAACAALGGSSDKRAVPALMAFVASDANGSARAGGVMILNAINDPRAADAVEKAANDPDPIVKEAAMRGLNVTGDMTRLNILLAHAASSDETMQVVAGKELGALKDRLAVKPLIEIVMSGTGPGRWALVDALMKIGDARAVDAYIALLDDPAPGVRKAAAYALEGTTVERAREPLLKRLAAERDPDVLKTVVYGLDSFEDDDTVRKVVAGYDGAQPEVVRKAIVSAVGGDRNPIVADLMLKALKDKSPAVRQMAAVGFTANNSPEYAEPLAALLKDPHEFEDVRVEAAISLSHIKDPRAVDALCAALKDKAYLVRVNAAISLGVLKDPRAVDALLAAGDTTEINMRTSVAYALTKIGGAVAQRKLDECTKGFKVDEVARNYESYIRQGKYNTIVPLAVALAARGDLRMAEDFWHSTCGPLGQYAWWWARGEGRLNDLKKAEDTPARPKWQPSVQTWYEEVIVHLGDDDPKIRAETARSLGSALAAHFADSRTSRAANQAMSPRRTTPRVREILSYQLPNVATSPMNIVGSEIPAESVRMVVDALRKAAEDRDWGVRQEAMSYLGYSEDPSVADTLSKALTDDQLSVRVTALRALVQLGGSGGIPAAIDALKDPEPLVRSTAAWYLADRCAPAAVGPLTALLRDKDGGVRLQAAIALSAIRKPEGIQPLAEMLKSNDAALVTEAAVALRDFDTKEAGEALAAAAQGRDLKAVANDYPQRITAGKTEDVLPLILALIRYGDDRMSTVFYWSGNPSLKTASLVYGDIDCLATASTANPNTDHDSPRNAKWPGATMQQEGTPADLEAKTIRLRPSGPPKSKPKQPDGTRDAMGQSIYENGE